MSRDDHRSSGFDPYDHRGYRMGGRLTQPGRKANWLGRKVDATAAALRRFDQWLYRITKGKPKTKKP